MKVLVSLPLALLVFGLSSFHVLAAPPVFGGGAFSVFAVDDPLNPTIVKHAVNGVFDGIFTQYLSTSAAETMVCDPCTVRLGETEISGGTIVLKLVSPVGKRGDDATQGHWIIVEATGGAKGLHGHGTWEYRPMQLQGSYEGVFLYTPQGGE